MVSEANGCVGTATLSVPRGWVLANGTLINTTSHATIKAFCDNRSRYEAIQPGLTWSLDAMDELVWSTVLHDPSTKVQQVKFGATPSIRLDHTSSNSWWLSEDTIIGDFYVGIEAEVPQHFATAATQKDIATIFDSVSASPQMQQ